MRISDWSSDVCSSDLRNATLDSADLRWADLRGACLRAAGLNDANLAESNGAEALTPNYDADGRLGSDSSKRAIDLSGASAQRADLSGAQLGRAFALPDRKSTRMNSSHHCAARLPSSPLN